MVRSVGADRASRGTLDSLDTHCVYTVWTSKSSLTGAGPIKLASLTMNVFLILVGGYAVVSAAKWQFMSDLGPGAGFFPTIVGVGMVLASLVSIAEDGWRDGFRPEPDPDTDRWGLVRVVVSIAGVLGFLLVVPLVGLTIAIGLLTLVIFGQYAEVERRGRSRATVYAKGALLAVVNAVAMIVLLNLLNVRLPRHPFDDLVTSLFFG